MSQLLSWAKHEFELNQRDNNGTTEREHLLQVERQTKKKPKRLTNPTRFPSVVSHIWSAFISLNSARSMGFSGPNPISYSELRAWKELTGSSLKPWEIEAIKKLDKVYLEIANG